MNAAVNYLLLLTADTLTGGGTRRLRQGLGALLGGLWAAGVWLPHLGWLASLPGRLLGWAGLCLVCFGWRSPAWKRWLWFFGVCCAFAGMVLAAVSLLQLPARWQAGRVYYRISGPLLIGLAAGLLLLCRLCLDCFARHRGRELTVLTLALGERRTACVALRDNGNTLREPLTGAPVLVARWQVADRLLPELGLTPEALQAPATLMAALGERAPALQTRLIPYRAVGTAGGLLLAIRLDQITENGRPLRTRLMALSPTAISTGGAWEALTFL